MPSYVKKHALSHVPVKKKKLKNHYPKKNKLFFCNYVYKKVLPILFFILTIVSMSVICIILSEDVILLIS